MPAAAQFGDLGVAGDAAVGGDDEREPLVDGAQDERPRQAVPGGAVADFDLHGVRRQERTQRAVEDGGAGQAVDVEVAVDEDALALLDGLREARGRAVDVGKIGRRVESFGARVDQRVPRRSAALREQDGDGARTAERGSNRLNEVRVRRERQAATPSCRGAGIASRPSPEFRPCRTCAPTSRGTACRCTTTSTCRR